VLVTGSYFSAIEDARADFLSGYGCIKRIRINFSSVVGKSSSEIPARLSDFRRVFANPNVTGRAPALLSTAAPAGPLGQ
jgi:hypothetical protein